MAKRNLRKLSANYRSRFVHDNSKHPKAARSKKVVRAPKGQTPLTTTLGPISETPGYLPFTGESPPWVLKQAKNWVSGLRNSDKKGVNPKDQLGAAKVPMHLVAPAANIIEALCMDDGNIKYGPYNIRMEPIEAVGYIAACARHLLAYLDGQDYDVLTGKPHLGYARATLGLVIDAWLGGTLIDNRPVAGVGGQLLDALALKPGQQDRSPAEYREIFETIAKFGKQQTQERFDASVKP